MKRFGAIIQILIGLFAMQAGISMVAMEPVKVLPSDIVQAPPANLVLHTDASDIPQQRPHDPSMRYRDIEPAPAPRASNISYNVDMTFVQVGNDGDSDSDNDTSSNSDSDSDSDSAPVPARRPEPRLSRSPHALPGDELLAPPPQIPQPAPPIRRYYRHVNDDVDNNIALRRAPQLHGRDTSFPLGASIALAATVLIAFCKMVDVIIYLGGTDPYHYCTPGGTFFIPPISISLIESRIAYLEPLLLSDALSYIKTNQFCHELETYYLQLFKKRYAAPFRPFIHTYSIAPLVQLHRELRSMIMALKAFMPYRCDHCQGEMAAMKCNSCKTAYTHRLELQSRVEVLLTKLELFPRFVQQQKEARTYFWSRSAATVEIPAIITATLALFRV